jgi:hypothetical protein
MALFIIGAANAAFVVVVMHLGYRQGYRLGVLHGWHMHMFRDNPTVQKNRDYAKAWKVVDELEATVAWNKATDEAD